MNNKTYGSRPVPRGHVNAEGTVNRPRKQGMPPPGAGVPRHKTRTAGASPVQSPSKRPAGPATRKTGAAPPTRPPLQTGKAPARPYGNRSAPPPRPGAGQRRPVQGQRPIQTGGPRGPRPAGASSVGRPGWIYPERGGAPNRAELDRYYRQRRQAEMQRARQRQEAARREALRQKKLRRKKLAAQVRGILLRFAIVFLLACGISAGTYFSLFYGDSGEKPGAVTYSMGKDESFEADGATAYYNGILYVDFTRLAALLDMPMAGSIHYMRFIIPSDESNDSAGNGTEEIVLFTVGSFTANINGVNVNMTGPCRLAADTAIWVPLSFVEHYMVGVTVEHKKADEISLFRTPVEEGKETLEPLSLRVKAQAPIAPVIYDPNAEG